MKLDLEYIIIGFLIISCLLPLYIYKKVIYKRIYKKGNIKGFLKDCEIFLSSNYPKIPFNFDIKNKYEEEKDIKIKQTLIAENFINQFINYEYEPSTQSSVPEKILWNDYKINSIPIKENKRPSDWAKRKETAWNRDGKKCNRCGTNVKLNDSQIILAKDIIFGGQFNLENIIILCSDCAKVVKSENKTPVDLNITLKLMEKVEN